VIPKECKRLIEVDFPIAEVSRQSVREKSIRHGHPSTLHLWWARRPLAACRAVLMGLLLPDPLDPNCPPGFKEKARSLVAGIAEPVKTDEELRKALLRFIADFANWDNASKLAYLATARGLVRAAYGDEPPLVVDPFAGGGSIPLEALRLGCEAFASDLNPVACLILKVMLEDIPQHGPKLAGELRRVGAEIRQQAEKELAELYPKDPDGWVPIAYLWARTVRCEAPNCGAEIPLVRSFWLCKKAGRKWALKPRVERPENGLSHVEFEVLEPKREKDVPAGTVRRAKATCLCCGAVLPPERVRAQLAAQRGGADVVFDAEGRRTGGARLLAVVTLKAGEQGRHYRLPTERDYEAVRRAQQRLAGILGEWERGGKKGLCPVPDEPAPTKDAHRAVGSQIPLYGMTKFSDLFTSRQKVALVTLARKVVQTGKAEDSTLCTALALAIGRCTDRNSTLTKWDVSSDNIGSTFSRQALPMVWDFAEVAPLGGASGDWGGMVEWIALVAEAFARTLPSPGQVQLSDATSSLLPDAATAIWFTDPPYYDAVPYADLSDFFFVWLKRALPGHPLLRDPYDPANPLTPKTREAVQCEKVKDGKGQPKDRAWFEEAMAKAFAEGRRVLCEDGVAAVVFAHKTTEGWEALLNGMIRGGWTITGSWPIATEMGSRLNARETASLATSVHLVCRPRPDDAPVGDWAEVLRELPRRVGDWMERLQGEGIRGADLVFACIGPALEIFSRYSKVETAEGREVSLAEFLEKVWEVVGRSALEQVLGAGEAGEVAPATVLEEDARLTALFLWTLQSTQVAADGGEAEEEEGSEEIEEEDEAEEEGKPRRDGYALPFDIVRRFAQPLGIRLDAWEGRIIDTKKGVVRLLPLSERATALFGGKSWEAVAAGAERFRRGPVQTKLFPQAPSAKEAKETRQTKKERAEIPSPPQEMTTLDRVHAAMLLQASGQSGALREFLEEELRRGPQFLRLANALSALYPKDSEERRLIEAVLLATSRGL